MMPPGWVQVAVTCCTLLRTCATCFGAGKTIEVAAIGRGEANEGPDRLVGWAFRTCLEMLAAPFGDCRVGGEECLQEPPAGYAARRIGGARDVTVAAFNGLFEKFQSMGIRGSVLSGPPKKQ
jgi:hypothetical protein